ncbi:MAG: class I SAM-dependent methyltransferase [Granulosicoccus sp.]
MADQKTKDYYNLNATFYGNVVPDPLGQFASHQKRFIRRINSGGHILDLRCGGGHATVVFIENGFEVTALDGSAELAKIASQRANIEVIVKDFSDLEFDCEFDGIWAAASLTHVSLDALDDVLERVCRSLKPNGLLFASFKCADADWRDAEGRFYSAIGPHVLRQLALRSGLLVDSIDLGACTAEINRLRAAHFWPNFALIFVT